MPRYVDHEARRRAIIDATIRVMAERGTKGASFRNISAQLGGSTTLITHYYATQEELLAAVAEHLTSEWERQVRALDAQIDDPWQRLRNLLIWLVPIAEVDRMMERAHVQLLADQLVGGEHRAIFERYDRKMRQFLRNHVSGLVPADQVAVVVDLLRVMTGGVVLSTLEHPDDWSPDRQVALVDSLMATVESLARVAI